MNPYENLNYWQTLQQQQQHRLPVTITSSSPSPIHELHNSSSIPGEFQSSATIMSSPPTTTHQHYLAPAFHNSHSNEFINFQKQIKLEDDERKNDFHTINDPANFTANFPSKEPIKLANNKKAAKPKPPRPPVDPSDRINPRLKLKKTPQADKRKMGPSCDAAKNCPKTFACDKFSEETRCRIFNDFWNNLNCDQRHIFVANQVFFRPVDRRFAEDSQTDRELVYQMRNSDGRNELVCQVMFLNTLDITQKQVNLWMKKYSIGGDGVSKAKQSFKEQLRPIVRFVDDPDKPKRKRKPKKKPPGYEPKRTLFDPNFPDKPKRLKGMVQPEMWKKNVKTTLRLEGKSYITQSKSGEFYQVKGRELGPTCISTYCIQRSNLHCSEICQATREKIFNDIWSRMDWEQRKVFVASMVTRQNVNRRRSNAIDSRRQGTLLYHLPNDDSIPVQICKTMFVNTTGFSKGVVLRWTKKFSLGSKVDESILASKDSANHASEWLDSLPKIISDDGHFLLEPFFTSSTDVYNTYRGKFKSENTKLLEKYMFKKIMKGKNLETVRPNEFEEKCPVCEKESKTDLKRHGTSLENSKAEKLKDKSLAKSKKTILLSIHLQPIRTVPLLYKNEEQIYKSKLLCYNFTIYDFNKERGFCYWFSEDQVGEQITPSIIISILLEHLREHCLQMKLPILIYSNDSKHFRNIALSNALLNLAVMHTLKITQKFSEIHHSLVKECHLINKIINRHINNSARELYLPSHFAKVIREIKRNHKNFTAIHLDYESFYNYESVDSYYYFSLNPAFDGLDENDIRCLLYQGDKIFMKFDYKDEWIELTRENKNLKDFKQPLLEYPKLFDQMYWIRKSKWDDLQDLKKFMPFDCQQFYNSLKYYED